MRLLRTLPKDSAGVSNVKENSQKEAKLDGNKWPSYDSIIQLKPSFSRISSPVKLILIYKMFKLQYYLLILTFSRVYKNQKSNIKIMGEGANAPLSPHPPVPTPTPMAMAKRLAFGILQGRGGISLLGNEDEPVFRGHVLTDQFELLVIFYKLFQLTQTHWIRNPCFFTGHIWEVYARKVL